MKTAQVLMLATWVCILASTAYALDAIPQASGFSGFVRAGAGALKYKSNLVPGITYFNEDRDGEAMSKSGVDLQLTYFFSNDPVTFILNGLVGWADFDEDNPPLQ